jgi:hypothetical protein
MTPDYSSQPDCRRITPLVNNAFLFQNLETRRPQKINQSSDIQSNCCNSCVIIMGRGIYTCIKCGSHCAIALDYERMSYMLNSIS